MGLRIRVLKQIDRENRKFQADTIKEYRKMIKALIKILKNKS